MYRRGRFMSTELDQQLVELCGSTGRSGFIELRRLRRGIGGDTEKTVTATERRTVKREKGTRYASRDGFKNRIATYQNEKNQGRYKIHRFEQQEVDIRLYVVFLKSPLLFQKPVQQESKDKVRLLCATKFPIHSSRITI